MAYANIQLMPLDDLPPLLTAEEVADVMRVSKATVLRWSREGTLAPVGARRSVRFRREDIEALLTPRQAS
jgi:excisionase family DNA binding protein